MERSMAKYAIVRIPSYGQDPEIEALYVNGIKVLESEYSIPLEKVIQVLTNIPPSTIVLEEDSAESIDFNLPYFLRDLSW